MQRNESGEIIMKEVSSPRSQFSEQYQCISASKQSGYHHSERTNKHGCTGVVRVFKCLKDKIQFGRDNLP